MNALFRHYLYHRLPPALLVCSVNDQASAMDTVSARVQLGSASTTTDFCALIGLLLLSTANCYFCPVTFAISSYYAFFSY